MTKLSNITKHFFCAALTLLTLAFMFAVGTLTVLDNSGTLFGADSENKTAKERIISVFNDNIHNFDMFLTVYSTSQKLMGTSVYEDAGYNYVIRDSEGFLHFDTVPADVMPYADAVAELDAVLSENGIPLLFIQAPTKETDGFTKYPIGIDYASADNAAMMSEALESRGVEHIDLSEYFRSASSDKSALFYRTDHHWTTETAFKAFCHVLEYLGEHHSMPLDMSLCSADSWLAETQKNIFLGSIGRRIGKAAAGLDDYTYIEPAFKTAYEVYYPTISEIYPTWAGSFRDSLVRESVLYSEDIEANRYGSYFEFDYGNLIIKNLTTDNDIRIAMVKDSFGLPFTAFLSTAVSTVDMIDLREFEGSLAEHLVKTDPDIVIILYSGGSFKDVMYEFFE